jgi:hypothetical protein
MLIADTFIFYIRILYESSYAHLEFQIYLECYV